MATRSRSPNYPSLDLGEAIDMIRKVHHAERRAKFPRETLAKHLGYSSLNGRALSKIGAVRAYGLLEGKEDALSVSRTALAILEAPKDSEDYAQAVHEAFNAPGLFRRIIEEYGEDTPSEPTLRWWLSKNGYVADAADKALASFLASQELANSVGGAYISPVATEQNEMESATLERPRAVTPKPTIVREAVGNTGAQPDYKIQLGQDRWLLIEVKGGRPRLGDFLKLEKFAKFQRELLADDDEAEPDHQDHLPEGARRLLD